MFTKLLVVGYVWTHTVQYQYHIVRVIDVEHAVHQLLYSGLMARGRIEEFVGDLEVCFFSIKPLALVM
jgi:hypothetical protein